MPDPGVAQPQQVLRRHPAAAVVVVRNEVGTDGNPVPPAGDDGGNPVPAIMGSPGSAAMTRPSTCMDSSPSVASVMRFSPGRESARVTW